MLNFDENYTLKYIHVECKLIAKVFYVFVFVSNWENDIQRRQQLFPSPLYPRLVQSFHRYTILMSINRWNFHLKEKKKKIKNEVELSRLRSFKLDPKLSLYIPFILQNKFLNFQILLRQSIFYSGEWTLEVDKFSVRVGDFKLDATRVTFFSVYETSYNIILIVRITFELNVGIFKISARAGKKEGNSNGSNWGRPDK